MNATLATYLEKARSSFQSLVTRIEESPTFERMMIRYENSDPRIQKRIELGTYVGVLAIVACVLLLPLVSLWRGKSELTSIRNLTADIKAYNVRENIVYKPAPPPLGWQPIMAANLEEFEQSVGQYMSSMGIPGDLTSVAKVGDGLEIKTTGASLRQLTAMLFLFDGWFPGIKVRNLQTSVHPESKEMIDFQMTVDFDATAAQKMAAGRGGDPAAAINGFVNAPGSPTATNDVGVGSPGDVDYNPGLSSPPPGGGGDYEEYQEPLEPPPDLPPPPPDNEDL